MARYTMISCVTHRKDNLQPKEFFSGLIVFFIDYRNKKESKANCLIDFCDHQNRVQEKNYTLKMIFLLVFNNGVQKQELDSKETCKVTCKVNSKFYTFMFFCHSSPFGPQFTWVSTAMLIS